MLLKRIIGVICIFIAGQITVFFFYLAKQATIKESFELSKFYIALALFFAMLIPASVIMLQAEMRFDRIEKLLKKLLKKDKCEESETDSTQKKQVE
jgi:hypothetical protein